jgi:hypothetical protein
MAAGVRARNRKVLLETLKKLNMTTEEEMARQEEGRSNICERENGFETPNKRHKPEKRRNCKKGKDAACVCV